MTVSPATRRKARHFGMQALYQWHMTGAPLNQIETEFRVDNDMKHTDMDYFQELVHQIPAKVSEIDETYAPFLTDRAVHELDPITLALLRLSTYELLHRIDVPYKVVINESVSLAKKFGATDSFKFINAVLDPLAVKLRAVEVNSDR